MSQIPRSPTLGPHAVRSAIDAVTAAVLDGVPLGDTATTPLQELASLANTARDQSHLPLPTAAQLPAILEVLQPGFDAKKLLADQFRQFVTMGGFPRDTFTSGIRLFWTYVRQLVDVAEEVTFPARGFSASRGTTPTAQIVISRGTTPTMDCTDDQEDDVPSIAVAEHGPNGAVTSSPTTQSTKSQVINEMRSFFIPSPLDSPHRISTDRSFLGDSLSPSLGPTLTPHSMRGSRSFAPETPLMMYGATTEIHCSLNPLHKTFVQLPNFSLSVACEEALRLAYVYADSGLSLEEEDRLGFRRGDDPLMLKIRNAHRNHILKTLLFAVAETSPHQFLRTAGRFGVPPDLLAAAEDLTLRATLDCCLPDAQPSIVAIAALRICAEEARLIFTSRLPFSDRGYSQVEAALRSINTAASDSSVAGGPAGQLGFSAAPPSSVPRFTA